MSKVAIDNFCKQAQAAMQQGKPLEAKGFYLQALALRNDHPDIHYGLATACFMMKDLIGAAFHFKECTRIDPLRAGAFVNLGAVYNHLQQTDDAIAMLKRGILLDGQRAEGHYNLGLVYRKTGQDELALQAYREALKVNSRMADAHLNMANIYLDYDKFIAAIHHYQAALEIRPKWERARLGLEQAQEALEAAKPTPAKVPPANGDRHLDPEVHGQTLQVLHRATGDAENVSREFHETLHQPVEKAIQDLTHILLDPQATGLQVGERVKDLEGVIQQVRDFKDRLGNSLHRIQLMGSRLLK